AGEALPGVRFRPVVFTPMFQKFGGRRCGGIQLHVASRRTFKPYLTGVAVLRAFRALFPDRFRWRTREYEFVAHKPAIDLLAAGPALRGGHGAGLPARRPARGWAPRRGRVPREALALAALLMGKRLAIFGGSFNPPHVAHQMACLYVLETQPVDHLLCVPAYK